MKVLIVGLGFGGLYKKIYEDGIDIELETIHPRIITVDTRFIPEKNIMPDLLDVKYLLDKDFDIAHICTPNYLHFSIACELAPRTKILMIEKPGVRNKEQWHKAPTERSDRTKNIEIIKN